MGKDAPGVGAHTTLHYLYSVLTPCRTLSHPFPLSLKSMLRLDGKKSPSYKDLEEDHELLLSTFTSRSLLRSGI